MSTLSSIRFQERTSEEHQEFLFLYPIVERHARFVFQDRNKMDREESTAEAIAAALESYIALKARGKDPVRDFPSAMATFAVLHVLNDRHVGGKASSKDVLSRKGQRKHDFKVESLPASPCSSPEHLHTDIRWQSKQDAFEERFQDDTRTPVPDQAAFRIDFAAFLKTLNRRDRELAHFLSLGHSGKEAAEKFKMTPGRVSQLRQQWHLQWLAFHGEVSLAKPVCKQEVLAV